MSAATGVLLQLGDVRKRYGDVVALDGVSLEVRAGELHALLGPNGAGKSTAISLLLGLYQPDSGSVRLFGSDPRLTEVRRKVGIMMQEVTLPAKLRVKELLELFTSYYLARVDLQRVAERNGLTKLLARFYGRLSGGEKRRVQFAIATATETPLLILDEPTVGLDVDMRQRLWARMRELLSEGCGILVSTHYLEEAEALADRVTILSNGKVAASGSVSVLRASASGKRVRCLTTLSEKDVAGWPSVTAARREGRYLEIVTTDADAVVRRLLAADPAHSDLQVGTVPLSDVFMQLTRSEPNVQ